MLELIKKMIGDKKEYKEQMVSVGFGGCRQAAFFMEVPQ